MRLNRLICFWLIFNESSLAEKVPWYLSDSQDFQKRSIELLAGKSSQLRDFNILESAKDMDNLAQTVSDFGPNVQTNSPKLEHLKNLDLDCKIVRIRKRWNLKLEKRGCLGPIGKGFNALGSGASKFGGKLRSADEFFAKKTWGQTFKWFGTKTLNGVKRVGNLGVSGVRMLFRALKFVAKTVKGGVVRTGKATKAVVKTTGKGVKAVAKGVAKAGIYVATGVFIVAPILVFKMFRAIGIKSYRGIKGVLRFFRNGLFRGWGSTGKSIEGTGIKLQKAGRKMQGQAAVRLQKAETNKPQKAAEVVIEKPKD
ncbi:hypothetical protein BY996DRAFT_6409376 [Phakopsora pachyrhizi]|uniref:Expressed protein n=1 Tax=Phakopsora pachyrhizi TaxID=170000 RepID=A0AAV0BFI9_PHAPC|nr:hypothetical protein BY996DRAFT_6409376 [Phakopsora pachyrhizi]CAH7684806.1 expressed protein [Phakopsora pachyrhizi]